MHYALASSTKLEQEFLINFLLGHFVNSQSSIISWIILLENNLKLFTAWQEVQTSKELPKTFLSSC